MYLILKRLFDILLSFIAVVCLLWLFLPIIMILLCTGEHYVFYKQQRIGKGGRIFRILKFATMLKDSPNMVGGLLTTRNDPRVFPFGKFLRLTKLNELPQLFNILFGSMSIIGPRPLVKKDFENYTLEVQEVLKCMKPGLSSIGSVIFRDEEYWVTKSNNPSKFYLKIIQPHKGRLEVWYYNHRNFFVDCAIIFLTCWVIICPKSDLIYKIFKDLPQIDLQKEVIDFNSKNI